MSDIAPGLGGWSLASTSRLLKKALAFGSGA